MSRLTSQPQHMVPYLQHSSSSVFDRQKKTQNVFEWYYQNLAQGDHTYELLSNDRYNLSLMIRENKWNDFKAKHINKWFTERGRSTIEKWSMLNMLFFVFLCLSFPLFVSFSFPLSLLHSLSSFSSSLLFPHRPLWTYMAQSHFMGEIAWSPSAFILCL